MSQSESTSTIMEEKHLAKGLEVQAPALTSSRLMDPAIVHGGTHSVSRSSLVAFLPQSVRADTNSNRSEHAAVCSPASHAPSARAHLRTATTMHRSQSLIAPISFGIACSANVGPLKFILYSHKCPPPLRSSRLRLMTREPAALRGDKKPFHSLILIISSVKIKLFVADSPPPDHPTLDVAYWQRTTRFWAGGRLLTSRM